jgi:hypothetical protein
MAHLARVGVLDARDEELELTLGVEGRHLGGLLLLRCQLRSKVEETVRICEENSRGV